MWYATISVPWSRVAITVPVMHADRPPDELEALTFTAKPASEIDTNYFFSPAAPATGPIELARRTANAFLDALDAMRMFPRSP